jgi:2-polyprenyl-6-hydroxyphenyl methylase/3-demethylubiquinone-9 3-methyltransferase
MQFHDPHPDDRFAFGANWSEFLTRLNDERVERACDSLRERLGRLEGLSFLDIGCGSGLFSLAARKLGAKVRSFDFDAMSVACAERLRDRFFPRDESWRIGQGSILDPALVASLGTWDVVYSWGVLHHTGDLWRAMENAQSLVRPEGRLFISIYNDQGWPSKVWARVKQTYCEAPAWFRPLILATCAVRAWGPTTVKDVFRGHPGRTWREYGENRGMSAFHDLKDWVGGWPFEVASPEEVFDFLHQRGFDLRYLQTCKGGHGCNEFVLQRVAGRNDGGIGRNAARDA